MTTMQIIDFHAHLDGSWLGTPLPTPAVVLEAMDRERVEIACVFTVAGFYGDCVRHNDALLARANEFPKRLIPFVTVDPKEGNSAVAEVERCLANRRFRGVKFHPWLQAFASSMVRQTMTDILRVAAKYGAPILFHDGTPPYSTTFQVADVARWVPEATIVLGHAGLSDYTDAAAQLVRDLPNLYACYCGPRPGELLHLVSVGGADKVIFGSDFGLLGWELLAERIDNVREAGLGDTDLEKVLRSNAARLLRLAEEPL
jgi:predicted TIM-barrel fold metal-dependent hydrolase